MIAPAPDGHFHTSPDEAARHRDGAAVHALELVLSTAPDRHSPKLPKVIHHPGSHCARGLDREYRTLFARDRLRAQHRWLADAAATETV
jgi:hypothetical protein